MDAWKWWFGGIIFFTVTFCVAKCLLCPGRNHVQRARGGGLDTTQNGVDMQPVHAFEVTTNKHAPTVLRKIGGSLYRRIDEPHPQTCTAPPDAQDATRPPPDDPAGAADPAWPTQAGRKVPLPRCHEKVREVQTWEGHPLRVRKDLRD